MNKTKAFVKLDFLIVKQYFKPVIILFYTAMIAFFGVSFGNFAGGIGYGMALSTMIMPYPFIIGEKCNIDSLYSSLAIGKKAVVAGRYLYTIIFNLVVLLLSFISSLITLYVKNKELPLFTFELFLTIMVIVALFILIQSIQIPMFFKIGYTKAKFFSIIPMLLITPAGLFLSSLYKHKNVIVMKILKLIGDFLNESRIFIFFSLTIFIIICLYVSYKISVNLYKKREF
jgi:hypothetical protein